MARMIRIRHTMAFTRKEVIMSDEMKQLLDDLALENEEAY